MDGSLAWVVDREAIDSLPSGLRSHVCETEMAAHRMALDL